MQAQEQALRRPGTQLISITPAHNSFNSSFSPEKKKPAGKNGRVIQLRQLFFVNRYFIFKEIPDRPKMILRIGVTISLLSKLVKRNLNKTPFFL
jgi:hypothetical protein